MLKYRELYPNATENEYLYKKEPRNEKIVRCIKLKYNENKENPEEQGKKVTEGKETIHLKFLKYYYISNII